MEITTNQLSLTGVIMENPQFDHEVFGEAFFRTVLLYVLLIIGLRLTGKRQIGQPSFGSSTSLSGMV